MTKRFINFLLASVSPATLEKCFELQLKCPEKKNYGAQKQLYLIAVPLSFTYDEGIGESTQGIKKTWVLILLYLSFPSCSVHTLTPLSCEWGDLAIWKVESLDLYLRRKSCSVSERATHTGCSSPNVKLLSCTKRTQKRETYSPRRSFLFVNGASASSALQVVHSCVPLQFSARQLVD